ncbi:MAG: magnesium-translocating P-type ATPase [Thermodesulfobacteriota bacterium]|jgi:Mg2+-importing ATPase|nr:MAG: magnesium-translocating P-type ATPase [Thermodesulfobacteriota bacterium]
MNQLPPAFWNISVAEMLQKLQTAKEGLTSVEARQRLARYGANLLKPKKRSGVLALLLAQFKSPIILILLFATGLSFFLRDPVDAFIILSIVLVSGLLGFWQERGASNAVEKLLSIVQIKAAVLRDRSSKEIPVEEIVPGDIVILNAGDIVPGDGLIKESNDLFIDEAMLTGETFPIEKVVAVLPAETTLGQRTNAVWMGTHVVSGSAKALIIRTGRETEFGKVSERLKLRPQETDFERGIRRFGFFLMEVTLVLVVAIFAINVYLARPVLDSFLFSLALAVGLTPQLLPAIISINLAHGAKRMAQQKVIVKRLASIENFGSMNVICSDKTGTLTEGIVHLQSALDLEGTPSDRVLLHAYLNACYETGFTNPIDEAIRTHRQFDLAGYQKQGEIPYDFLRKRLSILVSHDDTNLMVTKGALMNVLAVCSSAETKGGKIVEIAAVGDLIQQHFEEFSSKGLRTLGVAYKNIGSESRISKEHEAGMTFSGFLVLFDPPKPNILETITSLKNLGVGLKIITGDNHLVAANASQQMGLSKTKILTGPDLGRLSDAALLKRVAEVDVFAEIEPNQKERIILALKKAGNVVGYMGDGINDASALHVADVGISVDSAVDVAKDAADIVLLEKNLGVLAQGVREGRTTFANTLKYVFMATSANFGNMFSMAGVSLVLPFLPLLPKQVLLTNLLTDFPEMTIATDRVDSEMVDYPRRWDIGAIRKFMITFGLVSSVFDYLTFGALLFILHATQDQFRTGWFLESVISASLIVLVIRSRKPFFKSKPGKYLFIATLSIIVVTLILPFIPLAEVFGFSPLPMSFFLLIGIIVFFYIITAEMAKRVFYKKVKF